MFYIAVQFNLSKEPMSRYYLAPPTAAETEAQKG